MWMNQHIEKAAPIVIRLLSRIGLFPNRLLLVSLGPQKLIEFDEVVRLACLNPDDSVLDIGCGAGMQTLLLGKKSAQVVGIDLSSRAIGVAENLAHASMLSSTVRFVQGDVAEADFDKSSFSRIVSFCVLEHIPDWQGVLKKAHEWLAPNGYLVISVDSLATIEDEEVVEKHKKDYSVVTYFDSRTLESALRDAGFSCVELSSILKSDYAKEQFIRNVIHRNSGGFNMLRLLIEYARLRMAETEASNQDQGIFLVAKAKR
jgi:2-polyprenyl-3-methyl-5-hydroxy-6-metoxy-1,4-benzoquinol methylase